MFRIVNTMEFDPIATNIRAAREAAKLTQGDLARLVGVRRPRVNDWESGRHTPNRTHLDQIAATLGHTRGWFHDDHDHDERA